MSSLTDSAHLLPPGDCVVIESRGGEAVGFQSFRMRVSEIVGDRSLFQIERFHTLGMSESERLKVTALNLFHPTASPPFPKAAFFRIATQSPNDGGRLGWGWAWGEEVLFLLNWGKTHPCEGSPF